MSRSKKVLALRHMPGDRDDRVSRWLKNNGYEITLINPAHGVPLPDDDSEYCAMVIYGGVQSVNDGSLAYMNDERDMISRWLSDDRPMLGLCLGGQLIAQVLGAEVSRHRDGREEVGYVRITPEANAEEFMVAPTFMYQWHNEGFDLPAGAQRLARGEHFDNQAYFYASNTYGFQFHPEVTQQLVEIWNAEVAASDKPKQGLGVDAVEVQLADAGRYDPGVNDWAADFLRSWTSRFS